jgi:hypothetical protein
MIGGAICLLVFYGWAIFGLYLGLPLMTIPTTFVLTAVLWAWYEVKQVGK